MNATDVRSHFAKASAILAEEKGRIKDRLLTAYASQLSVLDREPDLPKSILEDFDAVRLALSDADRPYGYGEHAKKKIDDMSEDDAAELARSIFSMFLRLHNLEASHLYD